MARAKHSRILLRTIDKIRVLLRYTDDTLILVIGGSLIVSTLIFSQLLFSLVVLGNIHVLPRTGFAFGIIAYLLLCTFIVKRQKQNVGAALVVFLYLVVALSILVLWGINLPIGILTLGFVIFLSNILLGSRYVIPTAISAGLGLVLIQATVSSGIYVPDSSNFSRTSSYADIFSYLTVFGIFAITARLSSSQNERSLSRAIIAEHGVQQEKRLLSRRLKQQAESLRKAQLEEMRQLYSFAELGQLTSSLFHELSNHLSVLYLDVHEISSAEKSNSLLKVNESISKIDQMVGEVRRRIGDKKEQQTFSIRSCIKTAVSDMKRSGTHTSHTPKILMNYEGPPDRQYISGDPLRLTQVMTILLNNAAQASSASNNAQIEIKVIPKKRSNQIEVIDYGVGISADKQSLLFTPHHSSKKGGLGIGLYIARQFIETHFDGTLRFDKDHVGTCFVIELPYKPAG